MGRRKHLNHDDADACFQRVYDELQKAHGLMIDICDYFKCTMSYGSVGSKFAISVLPIHLCGDGLASHTVLAKRFSMTNEPIGGTKKYRNNGRCFPEK